MVIKAKSLFVLIETCLIKLSITFHISYREIYFEYRTDTRSKLQASVRLNVLTRRNDVITPCNDVRSD